MRIERRSGEPERQVLIALIISKKVLGTISQRWQHGLFASRHASLIAEWSVAHYRKFNQAPKTAIQNYYFEWAERHHNKEEVEAVGSLLASLSAETERLKETLTPDHLIDIAGKLFEKVRLTSLTAEVKAALDRDDVEHARSLVEKSRKIEIGLGAGIDVFADKAALERAFTRKFEKLISFDGAMGNFYDRFLCRGQFISYLAGPKKGKSIDLQNLAWSAVQQGRRVAYFELGDHTQEDFEIRLACRVSQRPFKRGQRMERIPYPTRFDGNTGSEPDHEAEYRDTPCVTLDYAWDLWQSITAEGAERLKLWCYPSGSASINVVDEILTEQERDGWRADILILDYADLLAPIDRKMDKFEHTDETWKAMRGMTMKRHCLLVTATQCNREGFDARILTREHVGGYYMKLAYVTAMAGINQVPKEKEKQISRRNWVEGRDLNFGEKQCLWCAGCLDIGNPAILSTF